MFARLRALGAKQPLARDESPRRFHLGRLAPTTSTAASLLLSLAIVPGCDSDADRGGPVVAPSDGGVSSGGRPAPETLDAGNQPAASSPPPAVPPQSPAAGGATNQPATDAGPEICPSEHLLPPEVYGAKVKSLLTGMPLTASELTSLQNDPESIHDLVTNAFGSDQTDWILRRFSMTAFQQDQITSVGLKAMTGFTSESEALGRWQADNQALQPLLIDNLEQSFARTALRIVREGRPFSEVLTTNRLMMTTALAAMYSYVDHRVMGDEEPTLVRPAPELTRLVVVSTPQAQPASEATLNPTSPNFLRFYHPNFSGLCVRATEYAAAPDALASDPVQWIYLRMLGRAGTVLNPPAGENCQAASVSQLEPLLSREDFEDWRDVEILPPGAEEPTRFYDLVTLREANQLRSHATRVGFFTTLGFFGSWPTNPANSHRVTLNQTLIVALGTGFDGAEALNYVPPTELDEYETSDTSCYECHQTLGPLRNVFRKSFTTGYGLQLAPEFAQLPARFDFEGVQADTSDLAAFSEVLAAHPLFPVAWAQKLCLFANSQPCPESSPEFQRVVSAFVDSGLDFAVLVRELFASPLVTHAQCVVDLSEPRASIVRQDHLCHRISNRLGLTDVCALETPVSRRSELQQAARQILDSIPADAVARGRSAPVVVSQPALVSRAATRSLCEMLSATGYEARFGELSLQAAPVALVTELMGLPNNDPRHAEAVELLETHLNDAVAIGAAEADALRSAFVIACLAPTVTGVGL